MDELNYVKSPVCRSTIFDGASHGEWTNWRWQFANRLKSIEDLDKLPHLSSSEHAALREVARRYRWAVTPYYLSLIDWADPGDPIRRQCVPDPEEIKVSLPGSECDPLHERDHMPVPGLIHRYPDRVLAMVTGTCAMYCRHCNRKRTWRLPEARGSAKGLDAMVAYVAKTPVVREVIVSGGDPLTMNMEVLDEFLRALGRIPHLEVIRIGTRIPVVMPMRITDDLCRMLSRHRPLWINTHFNHPREVTPEAQEACDKLLRSGLPVSNQAVLLKGVNDSLETIRSLCHALQRIMVRPYYLFHCDAVTGTDHFRTDIRKGAGIMKELWCRTGGLAIPTFVVDLPDGGGKAPLGHSYLLSVDGDEAVFCTFEGRIVRYRGAMGHESQAGE